ncbi:excinuclease ABC subunit UvrA [Nocardia sp. NPDC006630]|uniref:excinuclease ABC subunit UvrA n=1 Tax=Nocardia sp. NPDC006630 TaxID=3157181 RepID=UPI0033BE25F2
MNRVGRNAAGDDGFVRVRGARVNNLCDVDVAVPRDALVSFTGVSGSGKSSLAFGTIYAESQRRFLESVAPYARRLMHQMDPPDVDEVTGLPPAVALGQRRAAASSRSTVGTVTGMSNTLRMLMSRAGAYPPGAEQLNSNAFSPNTIEGACPRCHGAGELHEATEKSMVPDPSLSIREGAIACWPGAWQGKNLRDILHALGYDIDRPWRELPQQQRDWILFTEEKPVVTVHPHRDAGRIQRSYEGAYTGAEQLLLRSFAESKSQTRRERAATFLTTVTCQVCHGKRLNQQALAVTFAGYDITDLTRMPMNSLTDLLRPFAPGRDAAAVLVQDLSARLAVASELGLGYLAIGRDTTTLSGGELQRLRLSAQLRSGLFGVVYVLDEPSAGLHPADSETLISVLRRLTDAGNSVFLVEHDMAIVRHSDWLVDVGPAAGTQGGRVLHSGALESLRAVEGSVTRRYLFADTTPPPRTARNSTRQLRLRGVHRHNLRDLDIDVPLGVFTAITGVSGSGKTSLLHAIHDAASADPAISRVVTVDQLPIGRTPRSNAATYTGLFDTVRKLFADTDTARSRGYDAGRFSFNVPGGRCEPCQGEGYVTVELLFLPSANSPCPDCSGARYNRDTLDITYRGKNIAEVLATTVDDATGLLNDSPPARRVLEALLDVGLGYIRLGQPAPELSGGEAQRIKLATELQRSHRPGTVYLLDEPTTGLHPADAETLMRQLNRLVDTGATVVTAEHDMTIVAIADHVIDLGPGGGEDGGRIIARGTPADVAASNTRTAAYLRAALGS